MISNYTKYMPWVKKKNCENSIIEQHSKFFQQKFALKLSLMIPPCVQYVTTLPCEVRMSAQSSCAVAVMLTDELLIQILTCGRLKLQFYKNWWSCDKNLDFLNYSVSENFMTSLQFHRLIRQHFTVFCSHFCVN